MKNPKLFKIIDFQKSQQNTTLITAYFLVLKDHFLVLGDAYSSKVMCNENPDVSNLIKNKFFKNYEVVSLELYIPNDWL